MLTLSSFSERWSQIDVREIADALLHECSQRLQAVHVSDSLCKAEQTQIHAASAQRLQAKLADIMIKAVTKIRNINADSIKMEKLARDLYTMRRLQRSSHQVVDRYAAALSEYKASLSAAEVLGQVAQMEVYTLSTLRGLVSKK